MHNSSRNNYYSNNSGVNFFWFFFYSLLASLVIFSNLSFLPVSEFDEKRIIEGFFIIAAGLYHIFFLSKKKVVGFDKRIVITGGILITILLVSSAFSLLPHWAFFQVGWYILLGTTSILFAHLYKINPFTYVNAVTIAIVFLASTYLIQVFADLITTYTQPYHLIWPNSDGYVLTVESIVVINKGFLNFSNIRFFNHLQTLSIPILVFGYLQYRSSLIGPLQYLFIILISSWWMLVFASNARGTLIAILFGLFVIGILYRKEAKNFILTTICSLLLGLIFFLIFFILPELGIEGTSIRTTSSGRIENWIFTLGLIQSNPILGMGPMHFSAIGTDIPFSTPHNIIFQSAVEWGLPATFLFLYMVLKGIYNFFTQKCGEDDRLAKIALVCVISAAIMHSMVSGIFNTPLSQLLLTVILGWIIGKYFVESDQNLCEKRKNKSLKFYFFTFFLFLNLSFIGFKFCSDIAELNKRIESFIRETESNKLYPRFWLQGKIGVDEHRVMNEDNIID